MNLILLRETNEFVWPSKVILCLPFEEPLYSARGGIGNLLAWFPTCAALSMAVTGCYVLFEEERSLAC